MQTISQQSQAKSGVEVSPVWSYDEFQYRRDLELAGSAFKETTTTSFLDVNFFDFLNLANECSKGPNSSEEDPLSFNHKLIEDPASAPSVQPFHKVDPMSASGMDSAEDSTDCETTHSEEDDHISQSPTPSVGSTASPRCVNQVETLNLDTTPLKDPRNKNASNIVKLNVSSKQKRKARSKPSSSPSSGRDSQDRVSSATVTTRKRKRRAARSKKNLKEDKDADGKPDSKSQTPKRKRRKMNDLDSNEQHCCCIKDCDGKVTNRLRFSLRNTTDDAFKPEFLKRSWNKICGKCYFRNFYRNRNKKR